MVWPGKPPGLVVGYVGELHPSLKNDLLNLPAALSLGVTLGEVRTGFELSAEGLKRAAERKTPIARGTLNLSRRLPLVERDLAFVVKSDVASGEMLKALQKSLGAELLSIELVDRFELPEAKVSLAVRLTLQGLENTLTDPEIQDAVGKVMKTAKDKFSAELRS
jgi:phenylalanyl-tRNA synthetase beta chain